MGSQEIRSKKKMPLWKKAMLHFLLCFVMGFFTGFAPAGQPVIFPTPLSSRKPVEVVFHPTTRMQSKYNRRKVAVIPEETSEREGGSNPPLRLIIVVTPTSRRNSLRGVLLSRLGNTLKLVAQPLLWIVVEQKPDDESEVSEVLRKTGIMYRHVVFSENFTDFDSEMDYQRNIALNHIEHHRLSGIVHFAGLSNVYDLSFFDEIRAIQVFGTWTIAKLGAKGNSVIIEGPVCDSSKVMGWHLNKKKNISETEPPGMHVSSFAFNSSILWDPERWGRTSSFRDKSQNSLKFVQKEVVEEEVELKESSAEGCSNVLVWDLHISMSLN